MKCHYTEQVNEEMDEVCELATVHVNWYLESL